MKTKKQIKLLEIISIPIGVVLILSLFTAIGHSTAEKSNKTKGSITLEDNRQLNEMEQYHLSQGRKIIVFE